MSRRPGSTRGREATDELILQLRETLGATIVVVTHDPGASHDADDSIFLDGKPGP
jgi:ABC-type transporter Mla maintaining outer membrane lipid asymmetry ATPase subunit MlaF